jgi:hypothetical protein
MYQNVPCVLKWNKCIDVQNVHHSNLSSKSFLYNVFLCIIEQTKRNYYIHGQNFHRFVLNHYKTSDKCGQRVLEVKGEALAKALRCWNRVNKSPHFINVAVVRV